MNNINYNYFHIQINKNQITHNEVAHLVTALANIEKIVGRTAKKGYNLNELHDAIVKCSSKNDIKNIYICKLDDYASVVDFILAMIRDAKITTFTYNDKNYIVPKAHDNNSIVCVIFINHLIQSGLLPENFYVYDRFFKSYKLPGYFWKKKTPEYIFDQLRTHDLVINDKTFSMLYHVKPTDSKHEGTYQETILALVKELSEYRDLGTVSELIDMRCRFDILMHSKELGLTVDDNAE